MPESNVNEDGSEKKVEEGVQTDESSSSDVDKSEGVKDESDESSEEQKSEEKAE